MKDKNKELSAMDLLKLFDEKGIGQRRMCSHKGEYMEDCPECTKEWKRVKEFFNKYTVKKAVKVWVEN